jgi:preprotein translocase subunit YajC
MEYLNILLMGPAKPGQNQFTQFFPLILIIGVFYFFMLRPQMKKQKEEKKFRESLQKGDSVVTIGGLHGKIVEVEGATVVLEVATGVRLRFEKSAISLNTNTAATGSNALEKK